MCNLSCDIAADNNPFRKSIQSRCAILRFTKPSDAEVYARLEEICKKEDVRYTTEISGDLERWQVFKSSVADSGSLIFRAVGGDTVVSVPMSGAQQFVRVRVAYTGE